MNPWWEQQVGQMKCQAHVLIGGIPFPCAMMPVKNWSPESLAKAGAATDLVALCLLENVGDKNTITRDEETTFFGRGTILLARREGEAVHPSTGLPLYRFARPEELPTANRGLWPNY
jgi:hypothetical protein